MEEVNGVKLRIYSVTSAYADIFLIFNAINIDTLYASARSARHVMVIWPTGTGISTLTIPIPAIVRAIIGLKPKNLAIEPAITPRRIYLIY